MGDVSTERSTITTDYQETDDEEKKETEEGGDERSMKIPKKRKKKKKEKVHEVKSIDNFDIAGVAKCTLSAYTQKAVYCVVGEDVTAESQWKYIKKEHVVDNLELYEDDSDFLSLKEALIAYPEPEILVGFIPEESLSKDLFYIVHDVKAKATVLNVIEKKKKQLEDSLTKAVFKPVGIWRTLGSEDEIDMNITKNLRPLYEVEITSRFPVVDTKISFKMRKVEDARDGYVELLYDLRYPIVNVKRKRVDASVQVTPEVITREAQTNPTYPKNVWTQHEFIIPEKPKVKKTDERQIAEYQERLEKFVVGNYDYLTEKIIVNKHINLHTDDYAALVRTETLYKVHSDETEIFRSYSDVNSCKHKYITDVTWCRSMTGIIAVAYSDSSTTCIENSPSVIDEVLEAVFNYTPVLIWDHRNSLTPKLFLESPRQVVYVRFSPYDQNILVGGQINGQVVLWDIADKLENVSKMEILTSSQQMARLNLKRLVNWMKNVYNPTIIKPSIISNLAESHRDAITNIKWVHQTKTVTATGKIELMPEGTFSNQFYTSSLDGTILFWDCKQDGTAVARPQKKLKRLSRRPSALIDKQSKFVGHFGPHYKLNFNEGEKIWPILTILRNFMVRQECVDLRYTDDINVTNHFKPVHDPIETLNPYIAGSTVGKMIEYDWVGLEYNPGKSLYTENVTCKIHFDLIHEGPIMFIHNHGDCPEIILTTGGKIFAIWNVTEPHPILWRKCKEQYSYYVTGGWSENQPSYILMTRSDGYIELWDLLFNSVYPTRLIPLSGHKIMNMFALITPKLIRKKTLLTSDYYGTLTVYKEPELLNKALSSDKELVKKLFHRDYNRLKHLQKWMKNFNENHGEPQKTKDELASEIAITPKDVKITFKRGHEQSSVSELDKMDRIFSGVEWSSVREKDMYENILKKKKINLAELEQQRRPLQRIAQERREKMRKQKEILENKDKIFTNARIKLFEDVTFDKSRLFSLPHIVDPSSRRYLEHYDEIEDRALNYIAHHEFSLSYNWSAVMEQCKRRQRNVKQKLHLLNTHERYFLRRKATQPDHVSEKSKSAFFSSSSGTEMSFGQQMQEETSDVGL